MARLVKAFDATQHDTEQRDFTNLPDGDYVLEVTSSEVKEDRDEGKSGVSLSYDVVEPEDYKGRKVFDYLNIEHPKSQVQEIGQKQLASLCRACGLGSIEDTEDLHFISFSAKVGLGKPSKEKNADGTPVYPAKNVIKKFYFPDEGAVPEAKAAPQPANDNRAAANDNKPAETKARPWGKK